MDHDPGPGSLRPHESADAPSGEALRENSPPRLADDIVSFTDIREQHAAFTARRSAVERIRRFITTHTKGLFVIKGAPGKGKSALAVHLEAIFSQSPFGDDRGRTPVTFFFRGNAADSEACIRHIRASLGLQRGVSEPASLGVAADGAHTMEALCDSMREVSSSRDEGHPLILILDSLDESVSRVGATGSLQGQLGQPRLNGFGIVQQIVSDLPDHVYLIVTSRPVHELESLACDAPRGELDFDDPDGLSEYRNEVRAYVDDRLAWLKRPSLTASVIGTTADMIARVADGNYLVAKLLCNELADNDCGATEVSTLLRNLLAEDHDRRLGYLYRRFVNRVLPDDKSAGPIAAVLRALTFAEGDLTPALIRLATSMSEDDWRTARSAIAEYLYVKPADSPSDDDRIRFFHRSFQDFLRGSVYRGSEHETHTSLAKACWRWRELTGNGRTYALQHAVFHSTEASDDDSLAHCFSDYEFIEAAAGCGLIPSLRNDLNVIAVRLASEGRVEAGIIRDFADAVSARIQFLERHPDTLFQCMWNDLWWIDSDLTNEWRGAPSVATAVASKTPNAADAASAPRAAFMESWRRWKEAAQPGFSWLRAVTPPARQPGRRFFLEGHTAQVTALDTTADGSAALSASADMSLRLWDVRAGRVKRAPMALEHQINVIRYCAEYGQQGAFLGGDAKGQLLVWNAATLDRIAKVPVHPGGITTVSVAGDGKWVVIGGRNRSLAILEMPSLKVVARWDADKHLGSGGSGQVVSAVIDPIDDSVLFTVGSPIYRWNWRSDEWATWMAGTQDGLYTLCDVSRDGKRFGLCQINHRDDQFLGDCLVLDMTEAQAIVTHEPEVQAEMLVEKQTFYGAITKSVAEVRFSRDGRLFAIADQRSLHLSYWKAPAFYGCVSMREGISLLLGGVGCVAFADGGFVLCGTATGVIEARDLDAAESAERPVDGTPHKFLERLAGLQTQADFVLDPDGRCYVAPVANPSSGTLVFEVRSARDPSECLRVFEPLEHGVTPAVTCGAISRHGERAVFGLASGQLVFLDSPSDAQADCYVVDLTRPLNLQDAISLSSITAVGVAPHGSTVVAGTKDGRVLTWLDHMGVLWEASIGEHKIDIVAISHDGTLIAAGSQESQLAILIAKSGAVLHQWSSLRTPEEQRRNTRLVFLHVDAQGERVACGFSSGALWWLDLGTGGWTPGGKVRHLGEFPALAENWPDRVYRNDENDVAVESRTDERGITWLSVDSNPGQRVVADRATRVVVALGGLTAPARFYIREGSRPPTC